MHHKCNVPESSPNHPSLQSLEKLSSMNPAPGAKNVEDPCFILQVSQSDPQVAPELLFIESSWDPVPEWQFQQDSMVNRWLLLARA